MNYDFFFFIVSSVLERDGFGSRPAFGCFVAAVKESNEVIGYAMHFNTYSAWEGKGLYLQDIYVQPLHRKKVSLFHKLYLSW